MPTIKDPKMLACPVCNSENVDLLGDVLKGNIKEYDYFCCECDKEFTVKTIMIEMKWED